MSDNNRKAGIISGKGYYIALILCAAAIGITGYMYTRNANPEQIILQESADHDVLAGNLPTEEVVEALATQPSTEDATVPSTKATEPPAKKTLKTTTPVPGSSIQEYSMEALSYNETTRDWRVHNGIDYAAEAGTQVCAAADGQVYTVYEDDSLGYTVVIRHAGGYTTCYSSLSQEICVQSGDTVTMGQTIGYVGSSALVETTMGSHLHFSVTYQDEPMNPADFLALG